MKVSKKLHESGQKLVSGYEKMLKRVKEAQSAWQAEHGESVKTHIATAKKKAVKLGELTEHEAEQIAQYISRDVADAAKFMSQVSEQFQDWLRLDFESVEEDLLDACQQVADKSVIEWQLLRQHLPIDVDTYQAEQITGIGVLQCAACGETVNFTVVSKISPCSKCHETVFKRCTQD